MSEEHKKSFWTSLPGIMTGTASLLTAIVAFMTLFSGNKKEEAPAINSPQQMVKLANLSQCQEIVGTWSWFTGGETRLGKDGLLEWRKNPTDTLPAVIGRWTCTNTKPHTFLLSWQHGITDSVTLSPDRKSLSGGNQAGVRVSATRTS